MNPFLLILLCAALAGCESTRLDLPNGCVIVAKLKAAQQAKRLLLEADETPRIDVLRWHSPTETNSKGHAICVWPESRRIMCYDYERGGSFTLTREMRHWDSPVQLAVAFMGSRDLFADAFFYEQ